MRSDLKLLVLSPGYQADDADTVTIPSVGMLLRELTRLEPGFDVQVVTFQYPFTRKFYTVHGIPVYSAGGKNGKLNRLFTWLHIYRFLRKINREKRIDIIHAFWLTEATLIGLLFAKLNGIPFLATAMGQDVKLSNHYRYLLRYFKFPLFLISGFQNNFLDRRLRRNVCGINPFGVDKSFFPPPVFERTIDILGVGSLNKVKNYSEFIEVLKIVTERVPGLKCYILGKGNERVTIEKHLKYEGLDNILTLAGEIPYGETVKMMFRSRILLHCAAFEGQPLVITEALAAGMYVVCHPVGISAMIASNRLFTGTTAKELAEKILHLLQLPVTEYKQEFQFTIGETCRVYQHFYSEIT